MSYPRVIPRDLFNDANLLKCYGQLWLKTEGMPQVDWAHYMPEEDFDIAQDMDGSTWVNNIDFHIRRIRYPLHRPLNSREPWPLYLTRWDGFVISVFTDDGELSPEILSMIQGAQP